jgi:VWFA-related protein
MVLQKVLRVCFFLLLSLPPAAFNGGDQAALSDKQKTPKGSPPPPPFTFKVPVDVVVVNAVVTAKDGKPVKDLTIQDFRVFEDGNPQPIHTFSLESYHPFQQISADTSLKKNKEVPPVIEPATSPRYFSLIVDDLNSPSASHFQYAIEAMKKFVTTQVMPPDLVMISALSGRAEIPFTSDRDGLMRFLEELHHKLNLFRTAQSQCPQMTELQAYQIANQTNDHDPLEVAITEYCACQDCTHLARASIEESVRAQARSQYNEELHYRQVALSSLRQHVRTLRHFEGRKSVILFSPGFISEDVRFEIQEVVDRSLRSGVIFNCIDLRGLYSTSFEASDRISNNVLAPTFLGRKSQFLQISRIAQENPLFEMAEETGGIFPHNSNDLFAGMKSIAERQAYYYVLTYASPNNRNDGRYHKIKLEVDRPGVDVVYRKGYYAPQEELSFETRKKEDILEALRAPGNLNKIPLEFSFNYFQIDEGHYQLNLFTQVHLKTIKFPEEDSRRRNLINLVLVVFDEKEHYVDGVEKRMEFNLTEMSFIDLLTSGLSSRMEVNIPPGRYKIKAVVREGAQSKMGSLTKLIEIP